MKNPMKNLSILLTVLSMGTTPLIGADKMAPKAQMEQPSQIQKKLGNSAISDIRQAYDNGDYNLFLKELDDSYQSARDQNQLTQLSEMREGVFADWGKWEDRLRKLQEQKGKDLIAAVQDEPDSIFKERVLSAAAQLTSPEQDEALFRMATLRQMAPGTGENADENKLIDLDLEYEYKSLHISMPGKSSADQKEKQIVLRMEKAKKMIDLSQAFQDVSLKRDVGLFVQDLDLRLAQIWDTMDLNGLVQSKQKPANRTEEKVASILNQYQEKFSDLTKQFIVQDKK